MAKNKQKKNNGKTITLNKGAKRDYFIEARHEAGLVLEGWELKSIRAGRVQLSESYIFLDKGEAFLFGANISPLITASRHIIPNPVRNRKCLLHKKELGRLIGAVKRKGYTLVPMALYWKGSLVKLEIGLALGKKSHDKRMADKEKDWQLQKRRLLKSHTKATLS